MQKYRNPFATRLQRIRRKCVNSLNNDTYHTMTKKEELEAQGYKTYENEDLQVFWKPRI